ncbi:RolB family protein [Paraburkholderia sp. JPY465]|uniref:RolB family protein n=1 Tax=Paraburkholderia sp. JPY465 TaxID=3042285 RepID=UPI003D1A5FD5
MSAHIELAVKDYNDDYLKTLKRLQKSWVARVRDAGCDIDKAILAEFENNPCINSPLFASPLECIQMDGDSAELAYIYLPKSRADECALRGGLTDIPDWMCSWQDEMKKFVALDIAPTDARSTKTKIVAEYHRMGCSEVDADDIEHVLTIPVTDYMGVNGCVYYRSRPLTFDIIANTPVIPD